MKIIANLLISLSLMPLIACGPSKSSQADGRDPDPDPEPICDGIEDPLAELIAVDGERIAIFGKLLDQHASLTAKRGQGQRLIQCFLIRTDALAKIGD